MRRRNPDTAASRRAEIVGMLRAMPTRWRRAYNTARRTLADNGGPVLPDVPTPEQAMLILGNTAGGNRDIDHPEGDQPVPQEVRDEAMHGLRLSYKNDYPGWEFFGIARAIQLALVPAVPMRTRQRMKRYLDAHAKDKLAPHFGDEQKPSNGYLAWLNWGGDSGAAWNADVPRATYSSRTRGERNNPSRRRNPLFYREPGSTSAFSPVTGQRLHTMLVSQSPGAHPLEYFGEDEHFWSPERVKEVLDANPDLNRHFESPEEAVKAVRDALQRMVENKALPDLLPAGDAGVRVSALASAVPLVRELGERTSLLDAGSSRATPYVIGFVRSVIDYAQGRVIQAPPFGRDFGPEPISPYVSVNMLRPLSRRMRAGEVGYVLPSSGYEGRLFDYVPVLVTEVSTADALETGLPQPSQRLRVRTIQPDNRLGDEFVVEEWKMLRADEMPPHGDYRRVDPSVFAPNVSEGEGRRRTKPKVIAVVSASGLYTPYVVLFDPAVLVRGVLSEDDVLGFANATVLLPRTGYATISVAAAEPGYAYLMYATLAKHIASTHPGTVLRGSYQQTEYAKRFWARQPGGAIADMPPADFRRTFSTTYASIVAAGEELVRRLATSLGVTEDRARERLRALGSAYFDDYYGVSSTASNRLGPDRLRRPASPRETVEAVRKVSSRKLASRDLALVVSQDAFSGGIKGYLFTVPRGKSTLTPANLLAVWDIRRPSRPGPRFGEFADDLYGPLARSNRTPEADAVMQVLREFNTDAETPRTRREAKKWAARGEALKVALANAGQTDIPAYLAYLDKAASNYGARVRRIQSEEKKKLNPRRDRLAVRISMPV